MWSQLSEEQKKSYGEDYFERALRSLEKYTDKVRFEIKINSVTFTFEKHRCQEQIYKCLNTI